MDFTHPQLIEALVWKFPNNVRISVTNKHLTEFEVPGQPFPTDAELDQWVREYEALPSDDKAKDLKAAKIKRLHSIPGLNPQLVAFIEEELLRP